VARGRSQGQGGGDEAALRAATRAVAVASGWTRDQLERGTLEGSLAERQARAALEAGTGQGSRAGLSLSLGEARRLREALQALQQEERRRLVKALSFDQRPLRCLLDDDAQSRQELEALLQKVDEYLRTLERSEAASEAQNTC
jgi:hypothetical protein